MEHKDDIYFQTEKSEMYYISHLIYSTYYLGPVSFWHLKCHDNPNPNPRLKSF